jgi:hypothetical protein
MLRRLFKKPTQRRMTLEEEIEQMRAVVTTCARERIVELRGDSTRAHPVGDPQAPDLSPEEAAIWGS